MGQAKKKLLQSGRDGPADVLWGSLVVVDPHSLFKVYVASGRILQLPITEFPQSTAGTAPVVTGGTILLKPK